MFLFVIVRKRMVESTMKKHYYNEDFKIIVLTKWNFPREGGRMFFLICRAPISYLIICKLWRQFIKVLMEIKEFHSFSASLYITIIQFFNYFDSISKLVNFPELPIWWWSCTPLKKNIPPPSFKNNFYSQEIRYFTFRVLLAEMGK